MERHLQFYIDGAWVDSDGGRTWQVIDPSTEQPVTEITLGSAADVDRAVAAARRAFETFSQTSVDERSALLGRTIDAYKARIPDIAAAISREMGAPLSFAQAAQAPTGLNHFVQAQKALASFPFEEQIGLGHGAAVRLPADIVAPREQFRQRVIDDGSGTPKQGSDCCGHAARSSSRI